MAAPTGADVCAVAGRLERMVVAYPRRDGLERFAVHSHPIPGDSHAHLVDALRRLGELMGWPTRVVGLRDEFWGTTIEEWDDLNTWRPPLGICSYKIGRIYVGGWTSPNERVHILAHELAHAHGFSHGYREATEALTEMAAALACAALGLDTWRRSAPYIAEHGTDALNAIRTHAEMVAAVARSLTHGVQIEMAGADGR